MKPINILLTCTSLHAVGIIDCLKNNPDGWPVNVYVTNCNASNLPPEDCHDGAYILPRVCDPEYYSKLYDICKEKSIDIIFPTSSQELESMALHCQDFERLGVKVAISSFEAIRIAGNKIKTYYTFSRFMPRQVVANNASDVLDFSREVKHICCKATNQCGAHGFAIVDEEKSSDVQYFHAYGKKHYITLYQLCHAVEKSQSPMILQEYHEGWDYSVMAIADHGVMRYHCGCVGSKMEFGSIVQGEIQSSLIADQIAAKVIERLGIDGIVGMDFILQDNGKAKLLDINLRVTASAQFAAKAGLNLPWLRCKQLLGYNLLSEPHPNLDYGLQMVKYFSTRYYHD